MDFKIPYYKEHMTFSLPMHRVSGVLYSGAEHYKAEGTEAEIVKKALQNPIGSQSIGELAAGKKKIVIISSDHTRPVPSHITMPILLSEIRKANADAAITILIATGMHRATTEAEIIAKYGAEIARNEHIVVHDAYNEAEQADLGTLPSGGRLRINRLAAEADLLISEGFIEPHFFAGFSGGRKSVLPGIAAKETVLWNHNARFIASHKARAGNLKGNPIHEDMLFAAKAAGLAFILNVVINSDKKIIAAFSGDVDRAHSAGCELVASLAQVKPVVSDIAITSNGGYPLDQNVYQTVKGLTAGEACVRKGGVIIIASSCVDGSGGDFVYHLLADEPDAQTAFDKLNDRAPEQTQFDQWEAQILARILVKATVIVVSRHVDPQMILDMHMRHAESMEEALEMAEQIVGKDSTVTVIPDGISVIVKE